MAGQLPVEVQTTPPDSVPPQDSWVLGSNVPLETRYGLLPGVFGKGQGSADEPEGGRWFGQVSLLIDACGNMPPFPPQEAVTVLAGKLLNSFLVIF